MVGVALDVGVAALGVHAAARPPHVAEEQLEQSRAPDELGAGRVLGEADRVHDRHDLVGPAHLAHQLADLEELLLRDPGDVRDHLGRVAGVVRLHELEDAARVLEPHVALGDRHGGARVGRRSLSVSGDLLLGPLERGRGRLIALVRPRRGVVGALGGVVPAEEAFVEPVALLHEEGGVGVVPDVLVMDQVVGKHVVDEPAEVGDVGPGPDARVDVGRGRTSA